MINRIKEFVLGLPLPTYQLAEKKLNKVRALAAFSPDALSSIAYANQEIYLGLVVAGAAGLQAAFPVGIAITGLLVIVALSYYQTIQGYPSGGGSYVVARDNLGAFPGLIAAAALMVSYVLTASVSLTAGVDAIASAFPLLLPHRVAIALALLLVMTLANLRGLRETGTLMSIPVYLFLFTYLPMLIYGAIRLALTGVQPIPPTIQPVVPLSTALILHAFAAGCTALTGIESISNGVPVFKAPEVKNAQTTILVMAALMAALFAGSIGLTQFLGVVAGPDETILSALARRITGGGVLYYLIQSTTLLILAVAANTSFAGFPRVAAILAEDNFIPRQFSHLGDRLVFSNGIVTLAIASAGLIVLFKGDSHALVPLFAIGAFMAFTLSQSGMVVHWIRLREKGWLLKACVNGVGALATFGSAANVAFSRFFEGAWISIVVIPVLVLFFYNIRTHYRNVAAQLSLHGLPPSLKPLPPPRVVIPVSGVHLATVDAVNFARSISDDVTALYVDMEPGAADKIKSTWRDWFPEIPLVIAPSPFRSMIGPLINFLDKMDLERNDGRQAVLVMPEFIPAHWWQGFLHNQSAWLIRMTLLFRRRHNGFQHVMIDVPYHLRR